MRIADLLSNEQKQQLNKIKSPKYTGGLVKPKDNRMVGRNSDYQQMCRKDWEELMGIHRDTYGRGRGGAVRRK